MVDEDKSFFEKYVKKVGAKGLNYLDTVIKIIIFLIFLNLFITTYFYFTTSIQATTNRSNCGGASLCEAETHRHLFLEDNGNDKARDIYIIIVVIFSIYLLSEIFKSYNEDGINFMDTTTNNEFFKTFIISCFILSVILVELAKFYFISYDDDEHIDGKHFLWELLILKDEELIFYWIISILSGLILLCVFAYYVFNGRIDEFYIYVALIFMLSVILGYDIYKVVNSNYKQTNEEKNETSDGFESTNFNSKFNVKTAIDILIITFYGMCILVFGFNLYKKNYDITLYILALLLIGILLVTLYIFILNSSVDWSRPNNTDNYNRYFEFFRPCFIVASGIFPGLLALFLFFNSKKNIIKLIVFYYAILFIIYLFYVYFINHNNESGILSLAYFQLYNYSNIQKNEKIKGSENTNYYKQFNELNVYFVVALLIFLIIIGGLNEDTNLDNIIYGIIVFILASYITGIVYLLYNELFPIQQASFKYKKNLVDINNEISQHIKAETEEHTIDINKIRIFKIANDVEDIIEIHNKINNKRSDETDSKDRHMKNIRDIFSEISPKGSSYEDYRSQSIDQMQYEEYIYRLFSVWTNTEFKFQQSFDETIFGDNSFSSYTKVGDANENQSYKLYNSIIMNLPKNKAKLISVTPNEIDITSLTSKSEFINDLFKIPKTNNIEYVIKKNYKYVTGEEGEIQKYKVLSNKELDCLYYKEVDTDTDTDTNTFSLLAESVKAIKNIKNITDVNKLTITDIATATTTKAIKNITDVDVNKLTITDIATATTTKSIDTESIDAVTTESTDKTIYKLNQDIFDHYKNIHTKDNNTIILLDNKKYQNIKHTDITNKYKKLNPAFYTIGYDYENYNDEDQQQMNKDTAYSIPARYYACSYLNYFPNEDGSMSKVKFAKNIKEDNYNPLNTTNTIVDRIAKSYNANAEETKIQLAPEKFKFLLVFLVILAIILLMFLFNIIKKYFTGDVYTPQMYVLGILAVFLTIFIFGEVIFAKIK